MKKIGEKAKTASLNLCNLSINKKNSVLRQFSLFLLCFEHFIIETVGEFVGIFLFGFLASDPTRTPNRKDLESPQD